MLKGALAKAKHNGSNSWHAFVTPPEIIALVDAGAKPSNLRDYEWAKEDKERGRLNRRTFWFSADDSLQAMLEQHRLERRKSKTARD
jgi:hypothetical protein